MYTTTPVTREEVQTERRIVSDAILYINPGVEYVRIAREDQRNLENNYQKEKYMWEKLVGVSLKEHLNTYGMGGRKQKTATSTNIGRKTTKVRKCQNLDSRL